jgi:hypothetical protein
MSNIRNNRDMRSDDFRSLNHLQSAQSSERFMNHSNAASSTIMKDSGRRSNLNEQSQYERRHCAKRDSTTLDTTSECP